MTVHRITRWDPMRDVFGLTARMNDLFNAYNRRTGSEDESTVEAAWVPAVDVRETGDSLVLTMEIPGIDPKAVDIAVENNRLTVSGERTFDSADEGESYHRVERAFGSFARSFRLPNRFDADNIEARSKHGVLTLVIPKREEAKPRSIKVQVEN